MSDIRNGAAEISVQERWWQPFFDGVWVDLQGENRQQASREAEEIARLLQVSPGDRLLDVPCGPARHAIELASLGYDVTGLDYSPRLLDLARERADRAGVSLTLVQGDMRELPVDGEFDGAFCYWGSFGYFDDAGNCRFATRVAEALRPGGRLLIETQALETLLPRFTPRDWHRYGEGFVLEERSYDVQSGRVRSSWSLMRDGRAEEHTISIRIYSFRELIELLQDCGFDEVTGHETGTGRPFALGAGRLTVVASRRSAS